MRPHDDAQAWADELVYQLGPEKAADVAKQLPDLIAKATPTDDGDTRRDKPRHR